MTNACPCCLNAGTVTIDFPAAHLACPQCGHRWATHAQMQQQHGDYYAQLHERNLVGAPEYERKMVDRLSDIAPLLRNGMRILEIGCAEGELGRCIKAMVNVEYVGIELSADAYAAAQHLDRVSRQVAAELDESHFDLILSFHVLEHIPSIAAEMKQWHRLLQPSGMLMLEVPNEAGHPLLVWDANPEHLHQFTPASLAALLSNACFASRRISTAHFESVVYPDSLRVMASLRPAETERYAALLSRFRTILPGPFVIYGIGGDFNNYVAPVLAELPATALVDTNPARIGQNVTGHTIERYDADRFAGIPVLIASLRFRHEIASTLQQLGVSSQLIFGLNDIYG